MFKQHSIKNRPCAKKMSLTELDKAVSQAEENYRSFHIKLRSLIVTLKTHHEAMVKFNSSQIKATAAICDFLIDTPLSECALGANPIPKAEEAGEQDEEKEADSEEKDTEDTKEENAKANKKKEDKKKKSKVLPEKPKVVQHKKKFHSSEIKHSFDTVVNHGKLNNIEDSIKTIIKASTDVNKVYATRYQDYIIGYLEEWDKIIATRIEGRIHEFHVMQQRFVHYTGKVHRLSDSVVKQNAARESGARPRLEGKLERNLAKLSGADEAHSDFGSTLLSLIEDVTHHYWRDMVPLLYMMIQFSISHSNDISTVLSKLEVVDASLQSIAEQHGVKISGRLRKLKPELPPEIKKVVTALNEDKRDEVEETA